MRKTCVLAVAVFALALPSLAMAQAKDSLVGTWKLVSVTAKMDNGEVNKEVYGRHPTGFITYTADGRMMAIISEDGRKPLSVADRRAAPDAEKAEAFASFIAYAGTYTYTGDKVVHHVEISYLQNNVKTDLVRYVTLQGNRVTLRTPPQILDGVRQVHELVWERLK